MVLLKQSNYSNRLKLHSVSQNTFIVRSFGPFKGVILAIGDYTGKCVIGFPLAVSGLNLKKLTTINVNVGSMSM